MGNSSGLSLFAGKRVLIVESEYFLSDETRHTIEQLGAKIVGPVPDVRGATELLDLVSVDGAVLDILLDEDAAFPVAAELDRRGIEFVFAIGFEPLAGSGYFPGFALCNQRTELEKIASALFGAGSERSIN